MANKTVILQWNCRGLRDKREDLELLINTYKPIVICLQETLLSSQIEKYQKEGKTLPSFVNFTNYHSYFKCIESGRNGIAIYVRNGTFHSPIKLKTRLQALAVRVTYQDKEFIVGNHYISDTHDRVPSKETYQYIANHLLCNGL